MTRFEMTAVRWPDRNVWRAVTLRPGYAAATDSLGRIRIGPAHLVATYGPNDPRVMSVPNAAGDGVLLLGDAVDGEAAKDAEVAYLGAILNERGVSVLVDAPFEAMTDKLLSAYREAINTP